MKTDEEIAALAKAYARAYRERVAAEGKGSASVDYFPKHHAEIAALVELRAAASDGATA